MSIKKMFLGISAAVIFSQPLAAAPTGGADLGEIVVTASRMAQYDYKLASDVTVINQEMIADSMAHTVNEVIEYTVGVNVYDTGTAKTSIVDMRGFGDTASRNVLVLVNDRKVNAMDISGPDLLQIPLESVERIEIIRGAGSVLYGDNAVGGVINIITKEGKGDLSGRAGATYGSYNAMGEDLELSGASHDVSYYLYSKYFDTEGYRTNSEMLTKDFSTQLGYALSDKLKMRMNTSWHEDDVGLPGGLNQSELDLLGRRGSADPDDFSSTKDRYVQLSLDVSPWPENIEWGRFVVDTSYRNRDVFDSFNSFGPFNTKRAIDTTGITGKYIFDQTLFNRDVNFVTGVDVYDSENDILGGGTNVDDITISKQEIGGYGSLQYEVVDDLYANGGLRYTRARYDFNQRNVEVEQSQTPEEWVSMGGMKYEYAPGSNVHFNVQETFRFLATDEWYSTANFPGFGITPGLNLDLKHQTGMQYEAGIKHDFDRKVLAHATAYIMDIKNEIFFDPVTFGNSNYEKTRRVGLELGEKMDLLKFFENDWFTAWEFYTTYTYQNPEFKGGASGGKKIPLAPAYQATAGMTFELDNAWRFSLASRYVGSRFAVNDVQNVTAPIKPYIIWDAKVSYRRDLWEIFLSLNNLFDEQYFTYVSKSTFSDTKDFFPAPERNVTVGASLRF